MTKVEITLFQASPEALLGAQVRELASITEDEAILDLPVGLPFLRVQGMTVRAFHRDMIMVELLSLRALLQLSALVPQVLHTVVLLLLIVVGELTVAAVDPCLATNLQMLSQHGV
jgi:hypothetical protein